MARRTLWTVLLLGAATAVLAAPRSETADAYVLQRGSHTSISGSLDDLERLRRRFGTDFLWFRRGGAEYVIRDSALITEAETLFSPLEEVSAEQEKLSGKESELDREEEALDSERDDVDADRDELDSADESAADADADAREAEAAIDEREQTVQEKTRDLRSRQRDLEAEDRRLEAREDELERAAESKLWQLLDATVADGRAQRLSDRAN